MKIIPIAGPSMPPFVHDHPSLSTVPAGQFRQAGLLFDTEKAGGPSEYRPGCACEGYIKLISWLVHRAISETTIYD